MIGKITGTFSGYYNNTAIIDVHFNDGSCIGYEVLMKNSDITTIKDGELVTLYIKEIIKEDDDVLYGFLNFEDKCWFEELIKLSGLGPKSALAILTTYSCENILMAITSNDCSFFSSVSGIGSKLANRIPNEMLKNIDKINEKIFSFNNVNISSSKSKVVSSNQHDNNNKNNNNKKLFLDNNDLANAKKKQANTECKNKSIKNKKYEVKTTTEQNNKTIIDDAVNALTALGFSKQDVYRDVFDIVRQNNEQKTEDIIKKFLQKREK